MNRLLNKYYEEFHNERKKVGTVYLPERYEFFKREVGEGKYVIELGCRYGDILSKVMKNNQVIGVDIDRKALEICHDKYGIETKVVNLNEQLPLKDCYFDIVILTEVLEHLPYTQITLSEIVRILREDGKLVGSVPNGAHMRNRLRFMFMGIIENDRTHLHHFSMYSLYDLMSIYFKDVFIKPISGRFRFISDLYFSKYLLFSCSKPRKTYSRTSVRRFLKGK